MFVLEVPLAADVPLLREVVVPVLQEVFPSLETFARVHDFEFFAPVGKLLRWSSDLRKFIFWI